jgi:hypothetical protein
LAPPDKGGSDRAVLEIIDSAHLLSPPALRVLREAYAELVKISTRDEEAFAELAKQVSLD